MRTAPILRTVPFILFWMMTGSLLAQSSYYELARDAYSEQQYATSASLFGKVELELPGKTDAQLYQGKALAHLALLSQSDDVLSSYLQRHPDSFEALEILGSVEQRENKPSASLETFTKAARLHTPSSADLTSAALDYVLLNDYTDATHWLQEAVRFDAGNGLAWYDLGRCYYTQSHFLDAQKALERAEKLMPNDVRVPENLGLTFEAENVTLKAEQQYREAVSLARKNDHSDEWPYLDYGKFLLTHDRAAEAVVPMQAAVEANPKCAACHELLGRAFAATGKVKEGVQQLEQAVALSPSDPKVHYELGRLYHQAGDNASAKAQFAFSSKMYGAKSQGDPTE